MLQDWSFTIKCETINKNMVYSSKLATVVESDLKAPFSIATKPRCREGTIPFPGLLHFTLDTYLIMLSVKQRGIKYHFLKSLWYDSTWDWTPVSQTIGEWFIIDILHKNKIFLVMKWNKLVE